MATIRTVSGKTGTRYSAQIRIKGHSESKSFSTKTAAKQWAKKREVELKESPHLAGSEAHKHTLSDAIARFREDYLPRRKHKEQLNQATYLRWWDEHYGTLTMDMVQPPVLVEARDRLAKTPRQRLDGTLSPGTVNRYLNALGTILTLAHKEWFWVSVNPMASIRKLEVDNARNRYLSADERHRLLKACRESESEHLYTAVMLALTTGGRKMEVLGLDWKDIDFAAGTVTFRHTKNTDIRVVGLAPEVADILRPRRGIGLVFPGPRVPTQPTDIKVAWETARRRAGLDDFRFHDLRHTAASYLAMEGASLPELAAVLGHRQLSMVARYAHLSLQHIASEYRKHKHPVSQIAQVSIGRLAAVNAAFEGIST